MSYFDSIRYEAEDGIYFQASIGEVTQLVFLDISLLEDLSKKKAIHDRGVALTLFHGLEGVIYRMTLNALNSNPAWDRHKPLALLRAYLN